ncbi:MAG: hypothetical protein NT170_00035 [Candidatus Moranbacteria bacterium]|nr:hypothetical protein [Candidatus Moranbacteria bacterium]
MFKNIIAKGPAILLTILLAFASFGTKAKSADAAAGPAIIALSLIASSVAGYAVSNKSGEYAYMRNYYPKDVRSGPHYLASLDTYSYKNSEGKIFIGNNRSGKWMTKEDWEKRYGRIDPEVLAVNNFP